MSGNTHCEMKSVESRPLENCTIFSLIFLLPAAHNVGTVASWNVIKDSNYLKEAISVDKWCSKNYQF